MKTKFGALAWLVCGFVLGLVIQYTISERRLPTTASLDTLPSLRDLAAIATAGGFLAILYSLHLQRRTNERSQQVATRDATEVIFRRWWGFESGYPESGEDIKAGITRDIPALRRYFYTEFLPWYWANGANVQEISLKSLSKEASLVGDPTLSDRGRFANLTFFFDEVGWLGAAGLIDVNHVLGPMQHVLRRVWWVSKPWIEKDRETESEYWLDPVRHFGIEWLYRRSVVTPQIDLIQPYFSDIPSLSQCGQEDMTLSNNQSLRQQVVADEAKFLLQLPEELRRQIHLYDSAVLAMPEHCRSSGKEHARLVLAAVRSS